MLSTFLCHIVPYGRLCAVLELHWHHGYLKRSGKGQKKTHRPFICFTLCFCLSVLHKHRHSYLLNYLIVVVFLHISVCFALLCTYCLCMCMWGIFMQTEPPLCVCVCSHWLSPRRCWHSVTDGEQRGFLYLLKNLHCNCHCSSGELPSELSAAVPSLSTDFCFYLIHSLDSFAAMCLIYFTAKIWGHIRSWLYILS